MRTSALSAVLLLALAASPAAAQQTFQLEGGRTSVELDADFLTTLADLGVTPAAIAPARLKKGRVSFPIPGGVVDLATTRGEIFHLGGLSLVAGDTTVELLNFIIDTTLVAALTGVVVADGELLARVPVFDLGFTDPPEVDDGRLEIRNVDLTLTAAAASALNEIFGVSAFSGGDQIGVASLKTRIVGFDDDDDDDD